MVEETLLAVHDAYLRNVQVLVEKAVVREKAGGALDHAKTDRGGAPDYYGDLLLDSRKPPSKK